jgi:hypothetical protein
LQFPLITDLLASGVGLGSSDFSCDPSDVRTDSGDVVSLSEEEQAATSRATHIQAAMASLSVLLILGLFILSYLAANCISFA